MNTAPFPQLQVFLAVARLRSFSGAARELGVSTSAVSQSVRQLEEQLRVVLLVRTTRSVSLTDAGGGSGGRGPGVGTGARRPDRGLRPAGRDGGPGPAVGAAAAVPFVITPVLPTFRERHPRIEVEVVLEDRFVDIVAEGYDAGVRLSEAIERDMVQVRLTDAFRFVVVGAPELPRAPRHAPAPRGPAAPRVHHLPLADHRSALRLGAGARPQELARAGARRRCHQRQPADGRPGGAGPGAGVRLRADGPSSSRRAAVRVLEAYAPTVPASSSTSPAARSAPRRCASSWRRPGS